MTRPTNVTGGSSIAGATGTVSAPTVSITLDDIIDIDLSGLADGDTIVWDAGAGAWVVSPGTGGGPVVPFDHGSMGPSETLDLADGAWHRGTVTEACAITVTGFTVDEAALLTFELTGDFPLTWDADVDFGGGDDQPNASGATTFILWSSVGDSTIYGAKAGGSPVVDSLDDIADVNAPTPSDGDVLTWDSTPGEWVAAPPTTVAALDDLTDVVINTPATTQTLIHNGTNWVNSSAIWRPVLDGATGAVLQDGGTGEAVMALS